MGDAVSASPQSDRERSPRLLLGLVCVGVHLPDVAQCAHPDCRCQSGPTRHSDERHLHFHRSRCARNAPDPYHSEVDDCVNPRHRLDRPARKLTGRDGEDTTEPHVGIRRLSAGAVLHRSAQVHAAREDPELVSRELARSGCHRAANPRQANAIRPRMSSPDTSQSRSADVGSRARSVTPCGWSASAASLGTV